MLQVGIIAETYGEGNHAPIITSSDTFYAPQNATETGPVTAIDPDFDEITFSIVGGPDAAMFAIDPELGTLVFVPSSLPTATGTMNLLTGSIIIDGVSYTADDVTRNGQYVWSATVADTGEIVPGRGWLMTEANEGGPAADGALFTALTQPHTAVIEWEDFAFDTTDFPVWIYDEGGQSDFAYIHRLWVSPLYNQIAQGVSGYAPPYVSGEDPSTPDEGSYRSAGVNRIAWTLGTADDNVSRNGAPLLDASGNFTGILGPLAGAWQNNAWLKVFASSILSGYANRTIRVIVANADLFRSGSKVRIRLKAAPAAGLDVTKCYIGPKGTEVFDMTAATPVTFNGGAAGFSIAAGAEQLSDEITFAILHSGDYVVSFYTTSGTLAISNTTGASYYKAGDDAATTDATGYTLGTSNAIALRVVDVFSPRTIVDIFPFGSYRSSMGWIMMGFARKLTIYPPQPKEMLPVLSGVTDLPGFITDETWTVGVKTSTTVELVFDDAPGATSHEYWIEQNAFSSSPWEDNYAYYPLASNKIVTGLLPNTWYQIGVRGVNASGAGPLAYNEVQTNA